MTKEPQTKVRRTRLNAKDRRRQLLRIAISETANKGLGHVRHSDIAEIAGVAVSTVFFYFPTVEILDAEVIDDVNDFITKNSFFSFINESEPRQIHQYIEQYFKHFYAQMTAHPDYLRIFIYWSGAVNHSTWKKYLTFRQNQVAELTRVLQRSVRMGELNPEINVDANVKFILANFLMIFRLSYYEDSKEAIEIAIESIKTVLKP